MTSQHHKLESTILEYLRLTKYLKGLGTIVKNLTLKELKEKYEHAENKKFYRTASNEYIPYLCNIWGQYLLQKQNKNRTSG
jgi:hypothetical protein